VSIRSWWSKIVSGSSPDPSYPSRLTELGCRYSGDPATEREVRVIERTIGVPLPSAYRTFLLSMPQADADLLIAAKEPTPFGTEHWLSVFHTAGDVGLLLDSNITPRNMVTIATGHFSKYTCLSVAGVDHGAVYALDGEFRAYMSDEDFHLRYPDMSDDLREYLRLRATGDLPEKHDTYDHVYLVANDFAEFLRNLRPSTA
jgi:hypothetical protein